MLKSNFYNKYLKYKTKYQQLKQILGRGTEEHNIGDDDEDKRNYDRHTEDMYDQGWTDLDWRSIDNRFKIHDMSNETETVTAHDSRIEPGHIMEEKEVNLSECNNLLDILDKYLNLSNMTIEKITHYAYIVCIDDKYFLPDVLFISDILSYMSIIFNKIKDNSNSSVKITIEFFGLSINHSNHYLSAFNNPVVFLNGSCSNGKGIIPRAPYFDYICYIALFKLMSNRSPILIVEQLNNNFLINYRLYAFLMLFNDNIINLARNKIVKENEIIKLMNISNPYFVFGALVFYCNSISNEGKPLVTIERNYTENILKELVKLLNNEIKNSLLKKAIDSEQVLINTKTDLLMKKANHFNKYKNYNTSMNNYELFVDSSTLELSYRKLQTATS